MRGRAQVYPGDEAIPRFGIQANIVVSLAEHLHEFGRVGMNIARREEVHVPFHRGGPDITP